MLMYLEDWRGRNLKKFKNLGSWISWDGGCFDGERGQ